MQARVAQVTFERFRDRVAEAPEGERAALCVAALESLESVDWPGATHCAGSIRRLLAELEVGGWAYGEDEQMRMLVEGA